MGKKGVIESEDDFDFSDDDDAPVAVKMSDAKHQYEKQ